MNSKPHFKLSIVGPVETPKRESSVEAARRKFGQPFAHEPGATWKPRSTPALIEWLQKRGKA